jgi:hypothetical protein
MKTEKVFTKRKMRVTSIFLTELDYRQWLEAASIAGMSRAELMRVALREKTNKILSQPKLKDEQIVNL